MSKTKSKLKVKAFTKERQCDKSDIWNCFRTRAGFRIVAKDEARSIVGANAPRVMLKNKRIEEVEHKGGTAYKLTKSGETWLKNGITSFLRNHPERASDAKHVTKKILAEAS